MSNLERKSVIKVSAILDRINHPEKVIELTKTARSALDAAHALKVPVGAIVKTLVFVINSKTKEVPVVTLVAGDKKCNTEMLPNILDIEGIVVRPDARRVKEITGYSIGGVSPLGLPKELDLIIDTSLKRFQKLWSAAGHPHCVFAATFAQLSQITGAIESDDVI